MSRAREGTRAPGFVWILGAAFGLLALMVGCGGKASTDHQGHYYHPTDWLSAHPGQAVTDTKRCELCHAMTVLQVGSQIPNCMSAECHHRSIPGWAVAGSHGARAKRALDASGGSLASCQLCHGQDFRGGGSGNACVTCHKVNAPHPPKPWNNAAGLTHATTDPSNAPICVQCHYPGSAANPANHPSTPAPAGTAPGCFNNTLCHGSATPHILGAVWREPTSASFHGLQAKKDLAYCQACHGVSGTTSFDGGAASTKCSTCHTAAKAHSTSWYDAPVTGFPPYVPSHRNALKQDSTCVLCHDYIKGRTPPLPASPSCYSTSYNSVACHANGPGKANHPVPFLNSTHLTATQSRFDSDCKACHAVTGTSPVSAAPLCVVCHQAGSPLVDANCTSCHEKPPAGTLFPDVAGSHPKHDALSGITGLCSACHTGFDSGSQAHYDRANGRPGSDVLRVPPGATGFLSTYNAKAGNASFDTSAYTCSDVSCHGGLKTPDWRTGTIDVNSDAGCLQCHTLGTASGTPESNSPYSGLHAFHLGMSNPAHCTDCHAMANGTTGANNHFKFLATPQMEGPAKDTVAPLGNAAYYKASNQTCGSFSCHGTQHDSYSWTGGANHPVPFLGTAHTTVTQSGFDSNCKACHAVTGTSPLSSAPLCTVCHQAGSPLTVLNCASCHEKPPTGSAFPDQAGKHAKHNALANVTDVCGTCHSGSDTGTLTHYDHANGRPGKDSQRVPPAPTSFLATYNAKAGTASFSSSAYTCSDVSCHGGLTAPSWLTGSISVNTDAGCRQCHSLGSAQGVPEYNSLYSGRHSEHLGGDINALCTDCHSMTLSTTGATNHFKYLNTTKMEGPASQTVAPLGNTSYYNITNQTCGTFTCHGEGHSGAPWTGGGGLQSTPQDAVRPADQSATGNTQPESSTGWETP